MKSFLITLIVCVPWMVHAQVYQTKNGFASFESEMPVESFKGVSNHLTGRINLADSTADFYLDLSTLDTGIKLRDRQMRENFLETDTFPFAEFFGTLYTDFDPSISDTQFVFVRGNFTIHGVTKEMDTAGTIHRAAHDKIAVSASWMLKLSDFNIEVPSLLFYRLNEEIRLEINAELTQINE